MKISLNKYMCVISFLFLMLNELCKVNPAINEIPLSLCTFVTIMLTIKEQLVHILL